MTCAKKNRLAFGDAGRLENIETIGNGFDSLRNKLLHWESPVTLKAPDRDLWNWLKDQGISIVALTQPFCVAQAKGFRNQNGCFEQDSKHGQRWFCFPQIDDTVFWQPDTNSYAIDLGRAVCLWDHLIFNSATYAFDQALNIYADPIEWLLNKRDGIVVFNWDRAYYSLRDCPRISLPESLIETYEQAMKMRGPEVFVRPEIKEAAE